MGSGVNQNYQNSPGQNYQPPPPYQQPPPTVEQGPGFGGPEYGINPPIPGQFRGTLGGPGGPGGLGAAGPGGFLDKVVEGSPWEPVYGINPPMPEQPIGGAGPSQQPPAPAQQPLTPASWGADFANYQGQPLWTSPYQQRGPLDWARAEYGQFPDAFPMGIHPDYDFSLGIEAGERTAAGDHFFFGSSGEYKSLIGEIDKANLLLSDDPSMYWGKYMDIDYDTPFKKPGHIGARWWGRPEGQTGPAAITDFYGAPTQPNPDLYFDVSSYLTKHYDPYGWGLFGTSESGFSDYSRYDWDVEGAWGPSDDPGGWQAAVEAMFGDGGGDGGGGGNIGIGDTPGSSGGTDTD